MNSLKAHYGYMEITWVLISWQITHFRQTMDFVIECETELTQSLALCPGPMFSIYNRLSHIPCLLPYACSSCSQSTYPLFSFPMHLHLLHVFSLLPPDPLSPAFYTLPLFYIFSLLLSFIFQPALASAPCSVSFSRCLLPYFLTYSSSAPTSALCSHCLLPYLLFSLPSLYSMLALSPTLLTLLPPLPLLHARTVSYLTYSSSSPASIPFSHCLLPYLLFFLPYLYSMLALSPTLFTLLPPLPPFHSLNVSYLTYSSSSPTSAPCSHYLLPYLLLSLH